MSQASDDELFEEEGANDSPGMKSLRDALRKEKKARQEAEARAAEAEGKFRTTTLKQAFAEAKVPPGFAKLYEGELDAKAIKDWWKEAAADFGLQVEEEKQTPPVDPAQAEAARLISQAQQQAPAPQAGSVEALTAQMAGMSFPELVAKGLITQTGVVSQGPVR